MTEIDTQAIKGYLLALQFDICRAISDIDGTEFITDPWERDPENPTKGGGITRILTDGSIVEKMGIGFSDIVDENLDISAIKDNLQLQGSRFQALGVSLIIHPKNPFIPTTHMNVRFFQAQTKTGKNIWWFGGGYDLTPYYGFDDDCKHWHRTIQTVCQHYDTKWYAQFKRQCDEYFYLPHRKEHRGIGGLFFDELNTPDFATCFAFWQDIGTSFMRAYMPIVNRRKAMPYTQSQKAFQKYRRGRYVEFNLLYDRGTKFGLNSNGRVESIFMSLPSDVSWQYDFQHVDNAQLAPYLQPQQWVGY